MLNAPIIADSHWLTWTNIISMEETAQHSYVEAVVWSCFTEMYTKINGTARDCVS